MNTLDSSNSENILEHTFDLKKKANHFANLTQTQSALPKAAFIRFCVLRNTVLKHGFTEERL